MNGLMARDSCENLLLETYKKPKWETFNSAMCFQINILNYETLMFYDVSMFCLHLVVLGVDLVLTSFRLLLEARGFVHVVLWWLISIFLNQPWWYVDMLYDGCCFYCLLLLACFFCEAEVFVHEIPDLTIFESRSVILVLPSSRFERTEVCDLFLLMSCCGMFWLDHCGVFDQYC